MSDPDPLMPIGVFSTATLVSIKALRLYHEQGLLVPAWIDPATGYRSYRVSQLADAQVIKRLRDLDVPLAGVAEVVRARDPEGRAGRCRRRAVSAEGRRRQRGRHRLPPLPVAEPVLLDERSIADGVVNLMLPTTTCAVLTHRGSFASIGHTYRQLGAWVATNATVVDQPVRELYVASVDESGALLPDSELRTEIAWPIEAP